MQCKDIPDLPILRFLAELPEYRTGCAFGREFDNSVMHAMPESAGKNLASAKMAMLMRRGLVNGCTCGCRGDFELTEKGRELMEASKKEPT